MNIHHKKLAHFIFAFGFSFSPLYALSHIEATDGDLSDDYLAPTIINITLGDNILEGGLDGGTTDLDLFRLSVPRGLEISAIILEAASGGGGGGSFLGLQPGSTLSSAPSNNFADFIGYGLIPASSVGTDYLPVITLPAISTLPPFYGAESLEAGDYAGWLNETGDSSTYRLNFVATQVPEPSSISLLTVSCLYLVCRKRRA